MATNPSVAPTGKLKFNARGLETRVLWNIISCEIRRLVEWDAKLYANFLQI